jgi:ubiquinone/menaquinone biosynthesis C-methylase UbiE
MNIITKGFRKLFHELKHRKKEAQYILSIEKEERAEFVRYLLIRFLTNLPISWPKKHQPPNSFYLLDDLLGFRHNLRQMRQFDKKLASLIDNPYTKGIRAWEYGLFLSLINFGDQPRVLDIGPGASPFPYYLATCGARVTTIDIPTPTEKRFRPKIEKTPVEEYTGSVLKMPFASKKFDIVTAISTLEHLDAEYPSNIPVSYATFIKRTKMALKEMIRVCGQGGNLYLTSEAYLPQQKTDRWQTNVGYKRIGAAYKFSDIKKVFLKTLKKLDCQLVGKTRFSKSLLIKDKRHANFRGRYLTTFAIWAKKI